MSSAGRSGPRKPKAVAFGAGPPSTGPRPPRRSPATHGRSPTRSPTSPSSRYVDETYAPGAGGKSAAEAEFDRQVEVVGDAVDAARDNTHAYLKTDGAKLGWIIGYTMICIAGFWYNWYLASLNPLYEAGLYYGLTVSRGAAMVLNINLALILLTVSRYTISKLRGTILHLVIPFDKNITFHKRISYVIGVSAAMHTWGHYFNFLNLAFSDPDELNPILGSNFDRMPQPEELAFLSLPGVTGHIALLCFVMMYSSAWSVVRRRDFEIFWYNHHLAIVMYSAICVHGFAKLVGSEPVFWMFFAGPGFLYGVERLIRHVRGNRATTIAKVVSHPSEVIEIQMHVPGFKYKSGQYIFLNCPFIAKHEWHPFTISSAPEDEYLSVHIRQVGDWTRTIAKLLLTGGTNQASKDFIDALEAGKPVLRVDGPHGAASEDFTKFETIMLVGAGIGVTPFASILKSIDHQITAYRAGQAINFPIKKVYFYWVCRDFTAFEWFHSLLMRLEDHQVDKFLRINIFLTGKLTDEQDYRVRNRKSRHDALTGLRAKTQYGRPDWDDIFANVAAKFSDQRIGVFLCGPKPLSRTVHSFARKYTRPRGPVFVYQKENF